MYFTKLVFILLSLCFLAPLGAQASFDEVDGLNICNQKVQARAEQLSLPDDLPEFTELNFCIDTLIDLHNPKIMSEDGVWDADFNCGIFSFYCHARGAVEVDYFNFLADKESYIEHIKAGSKITEEELENMAEVFPGGFEQVISDSYDSIGGWVPFYRYGYRLRGLKHVVTDFVKAFFISEMIALSVRDTESFNIEEQADEYAGFVRSCLDYAVNVPRVSYCTDLLTLFASADSGAFILMLNLELHLLGELQSESDKDAVVAAVQSEYNLCSIHYFFEESVPGKPVEKIKSCVYSSLMVGFRSIVEKSVARELESISGVSVDDLDQLVSRAIGQCDRSDVIDPMTRDLMYYDMIKEESPQSIEQIARDCQVKAETAVVGEVAYLAVSENEDLKNILGSQASDLARRVVDEDLPRCVQRLQQTDPNASARQCTNYILAASIFGVIDHYGQNKISEILVELGLEGIPQDEISTMYTSGLESMQSCRENVFDWMIENHGESQANANVQVADCLKRGVIGISGDLVRKVFQLKIQENPTIQQYNLSIGEEVVEHHTDQFLACFESDMRDHYTVERLINGIEVGMEKCQLAETKQVIHYALEQILIQELNNAGLEMDVVLSLVNDYQMRENSIFSRLNEANDMDTINTLTEGADYLVIQDIAYDAIYRLIEKDTSDYLSRDEIEAYARRAEAQVVACAAEKTLGECQAAVTPDIMKDIFIDLLPGEIENQFVSSAQGL
ncbi:MAG: hypothetical protein MJK18_00165, partial [Bdellovibrionales bacterium]|nr:hypothetical protein [Bdellovibrionales bacterium]